MKAALRAIRLDASNAHSGSLVQFAGPFWILFVSKPRSRITSTEPQSDVRDRPAAPGVFSDLLPHLWRFRTQFREVCDADKVLKSALRLGLDFFRAQEGCVATLRPGGGEARILFPVPAD